MIEVTKPAAQPHTVKKQACKLLVLLALLSVSGACAAQQLAMVNFSGKTVGWLLTKTPNSTYSMYLTPDGSLLTLNSSGSTLNSVGERPESIMYEANDCSGPAWIAAGPSGEFVFLRGEIFQVGKPTDSLHARMPRKSAALSRNINSQKEADGVCIALPGPVNTTVVEVEEVNPLDYGITENGDGIWSVKLPSFEMQQLQSEVISCDSFESCPTL